MRDILKGLEYARDYDLVHSELKTLVPFISTPHTIQEIADILEQPKTTVHHAIQRLKLKGIIILKSRDDKGTITYEFNDETRE